jgi:hypothetical protein
LFWSRSAGRTGSPIPTSTISFILPSPIDGALGEGLNAIVLNSQITTDREKIPRRDMPFHAGFGRYPATVELDKRIYGLRGAG